MDNVKTNDFSRKSFIKYKNDRQESDGDHCNTEIVRPESRPSVSRRVISCSQKSSSNEISGGSKNTSSLLGSSPQRSVEQHVLNKVVFYKDAFEDAVEDTVEDTVENTVEDTVDDCKSEQEEKPHSSLSGQHRTYGDTFYGARPKTYSCSPPTLPLTEAMPSDAYVTSKWEKRSVKEILLGLDVINDLYISKKEKRLKYFVFIQKIMSIKLTIEDKVLFIEKMSLVEPFFKYFGLKEKTIIHCKFRTLGLFFQITKDIKYLQVKLIKSLILSINMQCLTNPKSLNSVGLSSLLNDVKICANDTRLINVHSELYNMTVTLLTIAASCKLKFYSNSIGGTMSSIVKLIKDDFIDLSDEYVRDAVDFLLKCTGEEKSKFVYFQLKSIILDIQTLINMEVIKDADSGVGVVRLLLPYLFQKIEQPSQEQINVFLVALSFLAEKSLSTERWHFNELVKLLLCAIPEKRNKFKNHEIINIFYSSARLLDANLIKGDESFFTEAIVSLIPYLMKNIHYCSGYDICTLIRCIGKTINSNINLVPKFND